MQLIGYNYLIAIIALIGLYCIPYTVYRTGSNTYQHLTSDIWAHIRRIACRCWHSRRLERTKLACNSYQYWKIGISCSVSALEPLWNSTYSTFWIGAEIEDAHDYQNSPYLLLVLGTKLWRTHPWTRVLVRELMLWRKFQTVLFVWTHQKIAVFWTVWVLKPL